MIHESGSHVFKAITVGPARIDDIHIYAHMCTFLLQNGAFCDIRLV